MSTAFIEDDGDPVLRSPQHLSETSISSHGRLAACVPGAAVPRQMQDVPTYGGVCRTLHKNCEQREQTHHRRFHPSRDRVTPLRGPREQRGLRGVHLRSALQYSSRRNARQGRDGLPVFVLPALTLRLSKKSKTCQT